MAWGFKNKTDDTRWALLFTYARWFYKPAFDFNLNTTKNILQTFKKQKYLLGFNTNPPLDEFTRITSKKQNQIDLISSMSFHNE